MIEHPISHNHRWFKKHSRYLVQEGLMDEKKIIHEIEVIEVSPTLRIKVSWVGERRSSEWREPSTFSIVDELDRRQCAVGS